MSEYINLNRIEFVVTQACSGRCKHCSIGELSDIGVNIDADAAVNAIKQLSKKFKIESLLTFGGEPLLFAETVCKIQAAARDSGIPFRQIITNGFFSKDEKKIAEVARNLFECGVNNVLLSVDVFHQEFIPVSFVEKFAEALLSYEFSTFVVHPAWVVNEQTENIYNRETKRLLKIFNDKDIPSSKGNNIFPSGNAAKYLAEFYPPPSAADLSVPCGTAPHTSRLDAINCISINPTGTVMACAAEIGNIYNNDILEIIERYDPYETPALRAVLCGGADELFRHAKEQGVKVDIIECRSACDVCHKVMDALKQKNSKQREQ